jgi:hypothetical protein
MWIQDSHLLEFSTNDPLPSLTTKSIPEQVPDILVTSRGYCESYTAPDAKNLRMHSKSVLPSRQTVTPDGMESKDWKHEFSIPGDYSGPFAVVPQGRSRYLVLANGSLVKIVDGGKPLAKMEVVYDKSAIKAVVHDTDEEKRYAFTDTHYFEVVEPLVLKPHGVKSIDTTNGATGLESAFHCARAIRGLPPIAFPKSALDPKPTPKK